MKLIPLLLVMLLAMSCSDDDPAPAAVANNAKAPEVKIETQEKSSSALFDLQLENFLKKGIDIDFNGLNFSRFVIDRNNEQIDTETSEFLAKIEKQNFGEGAEGQKNKNIIETIRNFQKDMKVPQKAARIRLETYQQLLVQNYKVARHSHDEVKTQKARAKFLELRSQYRQKLANFKINQYDFSDLERYQQAGMHVENLAKNLNFD